MRRQGLLVSRRAGTSVYYRVADDRVFELLEVASRILMTRLQASSALFDDLAGVMSEESAGGA